jgi:hypothetical protein
MQLRPTRSLPRYAMKRWLFFALVVGLLVLWHGETYGMVERRNRELERVVALGERQMDAIERQTSLLERQTEALNQCSETLDRFAKSKSRVPRS